MVPTLLLYGLVNKRFERRFERLKQEAFEYWCKARDALATADENLASAQGLLSRTKAMLEESEAMEADSDRSPSSMACQVGMTTDPERRKEEWKRRRPTLRNWQIFSTHPTKTEAQEAETREARARGVNSGEGGDGPERATWYVYYFGY